MNSRKSTREVREGAVRSNRRQDRRKDDRERDKQVRIRMYDGISMHF